MADEDIGQYYDEKLEEIWQTLLLLSRIPANFGITSLSLQAMQGGIAKMQTGLDQLSAALAEIEAEAQAPAEEA